MRGWSLTFLAAVAGAALLMLLSSAAHAVDECPPPKYPPQEPMLSVSAGTITVGENVWLTGTGFEPGEKVKICITVAPLSAPAFFPEEPEARPIAMVPVASTTARCKGFTVSADRDGGFTKELNPTKVGRVTITATGQRCGRSASVTITVLPVGGPLPETGSASWSLGRTGVAAVAAGAALVLTTIVWRRRRART